MVATWKLPVAKPGYGARIESGILESKFSQLHYSLCSEINLPTQIDPIPPQDAAPDKVIKAFVRMLNSGDRTNAELLLTPSALTVISRAEFEIPPVGDAHCQCQFSEPQFATTKRKLCYVECDIFDKNSEDTTSVTWMMSKLQRGWRVAGMMIADESNVSVNLISFENSRDVNRLQIELDEDSANVSTSVNDTE